MADAMQFRRRDARSNDDADLPQMKKAVQGMNVAGMLAGSAVLVFLMAGGLGKPPLMEAQRKEAQKPAVVEASPGLPVQEKKSDNTQNPLAAALPVSGVAFGAMGRKGKNDEDGDGPKPNNPNDMRRRSIFMSHTHARA